AHRRRKPMSRAAESAEALVRAAFDGNLELVKSLVAGADVNATDAEGTTVLAYALRKEHKGAVEGLRARGERVAANVTGGQVLAACTVLHQPPCLGLRSKGYEL